MISFKELIRFMLYWYLTGLFGVFCFTYYCLCRLFGRYDVEMKDAVEAKLQPSCLTDPAYGAHKYFKNAGMKFHYVENGERESKVVILIHENPGFWFNWRYQIPELAQYFRVIALDLRGCGDSDTPRDERNYYKEQAIQDIIYLINTTESSSVHVICSETSGYLGWELATKYPHLVSKLVFINAPHPSVIHQLFHFKPLYYLKYWYLLLLQIPLIPELIISNYQTKRWLQSIIGPQLKSKAITDQEIEAYNYNFSRKEDWRGVIKHLKQIELRPLKAECNSPDITIPTLMLIGSNHPYMPVEAAYRSAELVEKIKIKVVEGGENYMQITHSNEVNDELINFLVDPRIQKITPKSDSKSLVDRVFGAVTLPYTRRTPDVISISNGIKEAALSTGVNIAQTVWSKNYMPNYN